MRVAILDLHAKGTSNIIAGAVTDIIRSELVNSGMLNIVERTQMDEILKEQGFQASGCTDQSCAVEIGKLLAAHKILIGEVNKLGETFIITVRIVDIKKGLAEFSSKETASSEDILNEAASKLSNKLVARITGEAEPESFAKLEAKTVGGYYLRGIVPGLGQSYAGHNIRGIAYLSVFVAAGAFWGYSHWNYMKKEDDYDDLPAGTSNNTFDSKYKACKDAGRLGYIALGIWGLAYAANWVDIIFFSKPDFGTKTSFNEDRIFINFGAVSDEMNGESYLLSLCIRY